MTTSDDAPVRRGRLIYDVRFHRWKRSDTPPQPTRTRNILFLLKTPRCTTKQSSQRSPSKTLKQLTKRDGGWRRLLVPNVLHLQRVRAADRVDTWALQKQAPEAKKTPKLNDPGGDVVRTIRVLPISTTQEQNSPPTTAFAPISKTQVQKTALQRLRLPKPTTKQPP